MIYTVFGGEAAVFLHLIRQGFRRPETGGKEQMRMKTSLFDTHKGNVSVDTEVIAQYAASVADGCFGIVGMAGMNTKDDIANLLKRESMANGINVAVSSKKKLTIDFHVIVSYGVNIVAVSDNLVSSVRYKVEECTGLEIERINIFVEGVRRID